MNSPCRLAEIQDCSNCKLRTERAFCHLSAPKLENLDRISLAMSYPQRVLLFSEGQPCKGVWVLCSGRVKIFTSGSDGRAVMLRIASAGDVLGLSTVLQGTIHHSNAETLSACLLRFVSQDDFIGFLRGCDEAVHKVIAALNAEYREAVENLRSLALLNTATARVANLLLSLCKEEAKSSGEELSAKLLLTQQQIAQMTATTRESVTRLLAQLKREKVISLKGSSLVIRNRRALEKMAG